MAETTTDPGSDLMERPEDYLVRTGDTRVIVLPEAEELFVDIDCEEDLELVRARIETLAPFYFTKIVRVTPSREEGHYHVVLNIPALRDRMDPVLRIALQACFGSDRKRELLSLMRVLLLSDRPPTVFFEEAS
jgi:hypothetical protein